MSRVNLKKLPGGLTQHQNSWVFLLPLLLFLIKSQFRISNFDSLNNLPYKDAVNWSNCTKSLALFGDFPGGEIGSWCLRRPIFAEVNARIYEFTGSLFSLFLIYSLVFGACLYWNHKIVMSITKPAIAWLFTLIQLGYWSIYSTGQLLSENLGMILGAVGCGFLLKTYTENNLANVLATSFWISLCLFVRPSNLFLLLLPFFFLFSAKYNVKQKIIGAFSISIIELAPLIFPRLAASLRGEGDYGNAGNAWSSLYGLANGNASWASAYSNLPPGLTDSDYSRLIRNGTLDLIREDPMGIPRSVLENLVNMFGAGFPFFLPEQLSLGVVSIVSGVIFASLLIMSTYRIATRSVLPLEVRLSMLFFIFSTLLFFAISWKSEPVRVLSVFLPFLFLFILFSTSQINKRVRESNWLGNKFIFIFWIIAPITLFTINTFTIYSNLPGVASPKLCRSGEFSLDQRSIDYVEIAEVRANEFFSWGKYVSNLSGGILVQGISSSYPFEAHSIFISELNEANSYSLSQLCLSEKEETNENLVNLGYKEVEVRD